MRISLVFLLLLSSLLSCKTANKIFSVNKTPYEQYSDRLTEAKLNTTALGTAWFNASQKALQQPVSIQLPYKETGYFAAERPSAFGFRFSAKRGEKISITVSVDSLHPLLLFVDLWRYDSIKPHFLKAADTTLSPFSYEAEEDGAYLLRVQPELLRSGQYTVVISATGSLAFPVPAEDNPRIGSFWGAARDAGARKHEGIDIFGKFRTPVVAAADGYITSTRNNNLGGKVVFLRPYNKTYTLYYAHLDSQIVREGEEVKTGQVVGLMGNTGNARTTPTHLHFGIYTNSGAIDPLPFVDNRNETPKSITASLEKMGNLARVNKTITITASPSIKSTAIEKLSSGTVLFITSVTSDWYKVALPDGKEGYVNDNGIASQSSPLRTYITTSDELLLDNADSNAASKKKIVAHTSLQIMGTYNDYNLVTIDGLTGWVHK